MRLQKPPILPLPDNKGRFNYIQTLVALPQKALYIRFRRTNQT